MTTVNQPSFPSTYQLLLDGLRGIQAAGDAAEVGKQGTLRAGNAAVLLPDGSIVGKCGRLTYLRLLGIDAGEDDESRGLMFQAGRTNEDSWEETLLAAGVAASSIRRESATPISWRLPSGRVITGRPDMVLGAAGPDGQWLPERGLELKLVSSVWTARNVALKGEPSTMHLVQGGHYALHVGVPFDLVYTNRSDLHVPFGSFWPKPGTPGSEFIEYKKEGRGDAPLKFLPFVVVYNMEWRNDVLWYRRGGVPGGRLAEPWKASIITRAGIEAYYATVDEFAEGPPDAPLPPRPLNLVATGEPGTWSPCDYCRLAPVCDKKERLGRDAWVAAVQTWTPGLPSTGTIR